MTTFDMLEYGWLLASDSDLGLAVTWNGMATYNLWATSDSGATWKNIDVRTYDPTSGSAPVSMGSAAVYAADFIQDTLTGN